MRTAVKTASGDKPLAQAPSSVKSAARILDVLELVAGLDAGIRLNELARQLDIPRSSASGLMSTLLQRGYVESRPDGFHLAANYRTAGWVGGPTGALLRVSRPFMRQLVEQTEESAFLGIPVAETTIRYVAKEIGNSPVSYNVELDVSRQAYSTSIGMVVLAGMDEAALAHYFETHPLELITPHTAVDEAQIRQRLDRVRKQGYATMADTNVLGVSGVAVPIVVNATVLGGLAVIAPTSRFDPKRDLIVERTVTAAREISAALSR